MAERLEADPAMQGYKLLHDNPWHHDPRTYSCPTSNEVAIAWEGDEDDPLGVPEAKDVLVESRSGERFSVPYWHPAYMPLRYPLIFLFGKQSWHSNIPNAGDKPLAPQVQGTTGRGGSIRVTLASYYKSIPHLNPQSTADLP